MSDWVGETLAALTLDEKLSLLSGRDMWHTPDIARCGVPSLKVTDGPNGARGADGNHGPTSTSFPVGAAMGATWNPALIEEVGRALAEETKDKGAHVLLGPTVNIPRVPNAGRNFECFSEDPTLSGRLATAWIRGVQSGGVAACLKHFVCNDQEHDRYEIDAIVDERALREIYLEPFRIAVEEAAPWAVMSAYNTVNGTTASEHPLLDDVLRDDFGFDGLVMSDWFGTYGPGVMTSGLDLEMPGPGRWLAAEAVQAVIEAGTVDLAQVDCKVERLLTLLVRTAAARRQDDGERGEGRPEAAALARQVATESIVLLSNDGVLPLRPRGRIAVIGELAAETPHQGGGSSSVNAHHVVSILDGVHSAVGGDAEVTWHPGTRVRRTAPGLDPEALEEPGLLIEYFADDQPTGQPVRAVRSTRSYLAFFGTRDEWVDYERFAVRITGRFTARLGGPHRFEFTAGGRLRARIGGDLAVDEWSDSAQDTNGTATVDVSPGDTVDLEIEYASNPGAQWRWLGMACEPPEQTPSIEDAAEAAAAADVAVVVAGLTAQWESEGFDRPDLTLPGDQGDLISAVAARQPNTVVVLAAGSAVEMPWADDVGAVLQAWYGGQEVGHAVADVLFGRRDPGGRLPITIPVDSRQHPGLLNYPGDGGSVRYGEGVYAGYRGFDQLGLIPRFAFGHGLSYTTFEFASVVGSQDSEGVTISGRLTNTGEVSGTEVIQVFAEDLGGVPRRLVGFSKIDVDAGASATVTVEIPWSRLRWWDADDHGWRSAEEKVELRICGTFATQRLTLDP